MSQRFYINWPLAPGPVELEGPEAHHLATVCRLRAGDELCLFNGDGHEYPARILAASRRSVRLEVLADVAVDRELDLPVEVAAPLPKGDRAQFLVEKLTELGVARYVPLKCRRSVIHPGEGKIDKLERYVIEASKQCGRNVLMHIAEPTDWATYASLGKPGALRLLGHPAEAGADSQPLSLVLQGERVTQIQCAVGPEGGFTEDEIALAQGHQWGFVDLGTRTLRLETAAICLAAWASLLGAKPRP